ncbi:myosin tail-domain-containing protein [Phakopsora pachyrhizi]|nr:myosin tail-domain-containing protein [Phakopsora pachyrhizi]
MTDKNKDALGKDLLELIQSSSNAFITGQLFTNRVDPNSKKRPPSQGDKIKVSANALVEKLMRSQPSYIRTIKLNQSKSPLEYDTATILHQIKYLGQQENDVGIAREEWQMGTTKAFIKNPETLFALEHMRDRYWRKMAGRIQRAWPNYVRYRHECATRIQRAWKNNKEGIIYLQLRDLGHQILAGKKERRRFSVLGSRKFMVDYLNAGGMGGNAQRSSLGEMLANKMGLNAGERVVFSSKAHILVLKLGRSSKISPWFLVLTDRALYILITQHVASLDGVKKPETILERKINISTITSVALSNLRDDWIVINVENSVEQDPVLTCVFKTEFVTHLVAGSRGSIIDNILSTVQYRKKKDKMAVIKFQKDETIQRGDNYKSHTVSISSGLPATSVSVPYPKKKPGIVRPITSGKLLRKVTGAPGLRSTPGIPAPAPLPPPPPPPAPAASSTPLFNSSPSSAWRPTPPPPPARAPVQPNVKQYVAIGAFETEEEGENGWPKGNVVEVIQ